MKEGTLETKYASYHIENGVVHIVYHKDLVISLDVAKDIVENRLRVAGGKTMPLFFDIRGLASIDNVSRKYFSSEYAVKYISAGAFWVESLFSRLAGNIFIRVDKPAVPTKLFTDKNKALAWLANYKNSN